ncbi:hypothetical protein ATCC90586_009199 [Pythium insidiosum]|nr:hypothetical protein ATCC90586_009199 [Pythium insidiosum]
MPVEDKPLRWGSPTASTSYGSCELKPLLASDDDLVTAQSTRGSARVVVFDTFGYERHQDMTRTDILRVVQDAATPTTARHLEHDDDDAVRKPRNVHMRRRCASCCALEADVLLDVPRVHARDIRKLLNAFAVSNEPSVDARKQAILVNADPVRAVILRHQCLVLLPDDDVAVLQLIRLSFHELVTTGSNSLPFELRALEALLASLCRIFAEQFDRTSPVVTAALSRLAHGAISAVQLEALRKFKNQINEFESRVDGVRRALMDLLDSETDIRLLHLTRIFEEPSVLQELFRLDPDEAEGMIEDYLQELFSIRTKASFLHYRIQTTESVVTMQLDSTRNYLLGVDIVFSLAAVCISVGTFVTGAFGMNLKSGLEEAKGWFWGVTVATIAVSLATMLAGVSYFRRRGVFM